MVAILLQASMALIIGILKIATRDYLNNEVNACLLFVTSEVNTF